MSSIAAAAISLNHTDEEYHSNLNCGKFINNAYQPLYTCILAKEAAILACCSLLLTIVNIICIIIMALIILRIKEVVPLHQPNNDITNFFHHGVKVARDYNKTIHENGYETNDLTTLTLNGNNLAQSIVNRLKTLKSPISYDNQQNQEIGQSSSIDNNIELNDTESRRKLLHLKTFAKEYDLDIFNKNDYDLLNSESREKVRLLVSDLVDMCQEIPPVFIGLFHLQPCNTHTTTGKEYMSFYEEIIALLPPKWYQLFIREQQKRQIRSLSSFNRTYSLRVPRYSNENDHDKSLNKQNIKNIRENFRRRGSVPETNVHAMNINQETKIPVDGTRFRLSRLSIIPQMSSYESEMT